MTGDRIRVLLIEDNPADALLIREMLKEAKNAVFELVHTDRLARGIERLDEEHFDVVLLDLKLPDSRGIDTFTGLHAEIPHVPIIPLTGTEDEQLAARLVREGAQDYLVKGDVESSILAGAVRLAIERKKSEEALRRSEHRYRALFEATGTAMALIAEDGTLSLVNAEFEKLSGYAKHELEGKKKLDDFMSGDGCDMGLSGEHLLYQLHDSEPQDKEYRFCSNDGGVRQVVLKEAYVPETGNRIVSLLDISERRRMEHELHRIKRMESIGLLAGGIAHDFNNILTGVLGNISLAKVLADPDHPVLPRLREAEKASIRAQGLARQLLTFAKGGAPVKQTASIGELITDTAQFALAGSKVRCRISMQKNLRPVDIDEGQISQVINNLLINAMQAMPEGGLIELVGRNVEVSLRSANDGMAGPIRKFVRISIADQGHGIAGHHLPKIFDPYFTTKKQGSGLGLAIAHSIVEKHGGRITVTSTEGQGSVFCIFLPASDGEMPIKPVLSETMVCGLGKVLVMDDDEVIRSLAKDMLDALGYTADLCCEGSEALDLYRNAMEAGDPYEAVIVDLTVPGGMGGRETIEKLLLMDPHARAIASSGYAQDPIMSDFKKFGFKAVVPKPYRIQEFSQTLKQVISGEA